MELKTIQDYYDAVCEKFPYVPKESIKWILNHGWRQFYLKNSAGCDVVHISKGKFIYCGNLSSIDPDKYYRNFKNKLYQKAKIVWDELGQPYDGFYYFGIKKEQFEKYKEWLKTHDIQTEQYNFGRTLIFRNPDQAKAFYMFRSILRFPVKEYIGNRNWQDPLCAKRVQICVENPKIYNYFTGTKHNIFKFI